MFHFKFSGIGGGDSSPKGEKDVERTQLICIAGNMDFKAEHAVRNALLLHLNTFGLLYQGQGFIIASDYHLLPMLL